MDMFFILKCSSQLVFSVMSSTGYLSSTTASPGATFHCNPIPAGYARVLVDEVVDQYSGLELDIPGGDDEHTLGEANHRINQYTSIARWNQVAMEGCLRGICKSKGVRHLHGYVLHFEV